jgi:hypothetical protein
MSTVKQRPDTRQVRYAQRPPEFLSGAPFRTAILCLGIFIVILVMMSVVLYRLTEYSLYRELEDQIGEEAILFRGTRLPMGSYLHIIRFWLLQREYWPATEKSRQQAKHQGQK